MSTTNTHPKIGAFAKAFVSVIEDARQQGQAPPTANAAIAGMNLIADFYHSRPATEKSAKLAFDLAMILFYDYPRFREAYEAAAK
jgi:hypothetical protein